MGRSLSVVVVYGWRVVDPEGSESLFPWFGEDGEGDVEDWWLDRSGFDVPSPFDDDGNYLPGMNDVDGMAWFDRRREWLKAHPCPIEVESGGTDGYSPPLVIRPRGDGFREWLGGWDAHPLPVKMTTFAGDEVARIREAERLVRELELPVELKFGAFVFGRYL